MKAIREIMTASPEFVTPETSIREAAEKMRDQDTGALPVISDGRAAGIVTDRDITVRGIAEAKASATTTVADVMTTDIVSCRDDETRDSVIQKMKEHKLRRILVQSPEGKIIGIVSLGDLALAVKDKEISGDVLRAVSS